METHPHSAAKTFSAARHRNVLVMDDAPVSRASLVAQMGSWGYRIVATENVTGMLEVMQREVIDMVVMHVVMPGRMVEALFTKIAENPGYRAIPIIFSNAFQDHSAEATAVRTHFSGTLALHWLPRPYTPFALKSIVDKIFEEKRETYVRTRLLAPERWANLGHHSLPAPVLHWRRVVLMAGCGLLSLVCLYYAVSQAMFHQAVAERQKQGSENAAQFHELIEQIPTNFTRR